MDARDDLGGPSFRASGTREMRASVATSQTREKVRIPMAKRKKATKKKAAAKKKPARRKKAK